MKKIYFLLLPFIYTNTFSQSFERSFEPLFNSGINSIVHDSASYFYAVSNAYNPITSRGILMKFDQNGNFDFQKYFNYYGESYFTNIFNSPDGNFLVCGYEHGCDFGDQFGLLVKFSPLGDTIWVKTLNRQTLGSSADFKLQNLATLNNGNLVISADTTIYFCTNNGDSLYTVSTTNRINSLIQGLTDNIICGNQSGILIMDTTGQQVNNVLFASPVTFVNALIDSTYLVNSGNVLFKLDMNFAILNQVNLTPLNFTAEHISVDSGKIWISNLQGADFASFDLNLQLIDSFRTQASDVQINSFSIIDTTIMVAGNELATKNYCYLKAYSTSGNYDYYPNDLALIDVSFDTAFADRPSPLPPGIYRLTFVPRVKVENTGADTIHSFYVNAVLGGGTCGGREYFLLVDSINLAPGQQLSLPLDTLWEFGINIPHFPYTYTFCPWVSCADYKVDKNHNNDFICDSFDVSTAVFVKELPDRSINIYPNPVETELFVNFSEYKNDPINFKIYDQLGKKIKSGILETERNVINLQELSPGIFYIEIISDEKISTRKIVKL